MFYFVLICGSFCVICRNKPALEEICMCASKEMELEIKMRKIEEIWTENVLCFDHYKLRGPIYLDRVFTQAS